MSVTYKKLDFASRDHEMVSREWYYLLHDIYLHDHVKFNVNEGHRTLARQVELVREKGLWSTKNPTGAAWPSNNAPHIRTGSPAHAIDCDNAVGVVAAAKKRGVILRRPLASEPWHIEPDAASLHRYAHKHRVRVAREKARKAAAKARAAILPPTKLSKRGLALITTAEGCRLKPYQDSGGVWTIGYGHTAGVTAKTPPLKDQAAAQALLNQDLAKKYVPAVLDAFKRYGIKPTQGQLDATVSAVYNLGPGILEADRSFGGALKRKNLNAAADALLLYVKDEKGRVLAGLVTRRHAERALFLGK